jgi:hypothetical protein
LPASATSFARRKSFSTCLQVSRPFEHLSFDQQIRSLQLAALKGDVLHFLNTLEAQSNQDYVLKNHPTGVFNPARVVCGEHTEYGLRPVDPAKQMICGDDESSRNENTPVAVGG